MASQSICRLFVTAEGHPPPSLWDSAVHFISLCSNGIPGCPSPAPFLYALDLMSFRHGTLCVTLPALYPDRHRMRLGLHLSSGG